jgi:hypothetical protein
MSAQCWCFDCSGKIVSRQTFYTHGRKHKPDPPANPPAQAVPGVTLTDLESPGLHRYPGYRSQSGHIQCGSDSSSDESDYDPSCVHDQLGMALLRAQDRQSASNSESVASIPKLTGPEAMLLLLDAQSAHKLPDASTISIAQMFTGLMTDEDRESTPTFNMVKKMMERFSEQACRRIEICRNDCIAYYDTHSLSEPYQTKHSHRTKCPECNAPRTVFDPTAKKYIPSKVVYYFPIKYWVRDMFSRPSVVRHIWHDCGDYPDSHVTRSRGFKSKVRTYAFTLPPIQYI